MLLVAVQFIVAMLAYALRERMMEALDVMVPAEITQQMSQVTLTEDHEVNQAFGTDSLHEPFRMRIAVWAAWRNGDALRALGLQQRRPRLRVRRMSIVSEMGGVAQEAIVGVEQIAGDLQHPGAVGSMRTPAI